MTVKRIICLANSRKIQGRCIAGKEVAGATSGPWIRPVSEREHEEVSEYERQYEDGSDPQVLDIVKIPLLQPRPKAYQTENWLLDSTSYWVKDGKASWGELKRHEDPKGPLWVNGHHTYNGSNDKIPLGEAGPLRASLRLIRVADLQLSVFAPGEAFGNAKRRVQGQFTYGDTAYHLWVTDPVYETQYLRMNNGTYPIGEAYLTVSLGEPHKDACYKLIAAIIVPPEGGLL